MANNADATLHEIPPFSPRNFALSAKARLKSMPHTLHAVGSVVINEHISTVGVEVNNNVSPWITSGVRNFEECEAGTTLQELFARSTGSFQSISTRAAAQEIEGHLTNFRDIEHETARCAPFVRATNCALRELSDVKVNRPNASLMLSSSPIRPLWVRKHIKCKSPRFLLRWSASHAKTTFSGTIFDRHWSSNVPGSL
ncbi:hypothetical protein BDR07DRAFT_137360 [Suillus spraguei]|nr:hypothetical protein BDR07DRAFT_137360 [Suillus spraguei]